ncbi:Formyltetrahydrofolate deformylase [plant metagenome]|uniref:Formyltetrahydrofolate deformylase n=1 Tax=plant metagenome TaxID=1297885 RepID=A0A484PMV4_9ZZZZ
MKLPLPSTLMPAGNAPEALLSERQRAAICQPARNREFVLRLSCRDGKGLVFAVSSALYDAGCNILDSQQFGDVAAQDGTGLFFMRIHFDAPIEIAHTAALERTLAPVVARYGMQAQFHDRESESRVLILVSKEGHCLNDLLYRTMSGSMPMRIVGVASNHLDCRNIAQSYGLPFHHFPIAAGADEAARNAQQARILALAESEAVNLVVLARYMQILGPALCEALKGRAINIHHSFLPSFKGARPYAQAHLRGVKLIGATAHYVTEDLDEGPIIEQDVERIDHSLAPSELALIGRDVECKVLARAVKWHCEHRVLLNGARTVVFR